MPVPPYDQLISPLLLVLAAHDAPVQLAGLRPLVAQRLGLQPADLEELLPSGQQAVFDNRLGWAHDRLKRAGCSLSARRGWWQLTAEGRALAAAHPAGLPEAEVRRLAEPPDGSRLRPVEGAAPSLAPPLVGAPPVGPALPAVEQPLQRIRVAEAELRRDLARELLGRVREVAPGRFERMVLDLLQRMGYGLSAHDLQQTGRSGDGGIDGIINLDKLGLQKVYVQAKRWRGNVGAPEVQSFYGALASHSANMGVLITTSGFTQQARDTAARLRDRLVLVDGDQLAQLMIDHGAGVSDEEVIRIRRIDSDYFTDD
jgi:restriction system protein